MRSGLPTEKEESDVSDLKRHGVAESRKPSRRWLGSRDRLQSFPQPLAVFQAMVGAAKLTILQLPKNPNFLSTV
jgi:hypothetical protein